MVSITMAKILENKRVLVTGVSRKIGIGAAIAREFASRGADLFLVSWPQYDKSMPWGSADGELSAIVDEVKWAGSKCLALEIDLSNSAAPATVFARAMEFLGSVDILVNNAVCDTGADIYSVSETILQRHFAVNASATMFLCAEFVRRFEKTSGGRIINLTSGQGLAPMPDSLPYAMSKAAIEALTLSLSPTAGRKGITVNAIDPGPTDTGWMSENLKSDLAARSPFNRVGLPSDAAKLAAFLASDDSAWITGQILRSRGGL